MYEYKVVTINIKPGFSKPTIPDSSIESRINELGKQGWELVNVVPNTGSYGYLYSHTLYFKRKI